MQWDVLDWVNLPRCGVTWRDTVTRTVELLVTYMWGHVAGYSDQDNGTSGYIYVGSRGGIQ